MFIVEVRTTEGPICESHPTFEEALSRVNQIPGEVLVGIPFIFQDLPDGSQRLVRLDGKPLQWHRLASYALTEEEDDTPIPLVDELPDVPMGDTQIARPVTPPKAEWDDLPPLPLMDEGPDPEPPG